MFFLFSFFFHFLSFDVFFFFNYTASSEIYTHPKPLKYPCNRIKLKHYGLYVEQFIDAAKHIDSPEKQNMLVRDIANYMKKTLHALNKDFATDERLFSDINKLSDGEIQVAEGMQTARIQVRNNNFQQRNNNRQFYQKNNKNRNKQNFKQKNRKNNH